MPAKLGTSLWGRILKHTLIPVTLRIARGRHGPFSIVTTVGRRSGKTYQTPIIVQPTERGFMIELTYGENVQWYRNVLAAGGCRITYKGVEHVVNGVEPVDARVGLAAFSPAQRRILTTLKRQHFVLFVS